MKNYGIHKTARWQSRETHKTHQGKIETVLEKMTDSK